MPIVHVSLPLNVFAFLSLMCVFCGKGLTQAAALSVVVPAVWNVTQWCALCSAAVEVWAADLNTHEHMQCKTQKYMKSRGYCRIQGNFDFVKSIKLNWSDLQSDCNWLLNRKKSFTFYIVIYLIPSKL